MTVEKRIEALERDLSKTRRNARRAVICAVVAGAAAVLLLVALHWPPQAVARDAPARDIPRVITARTFILVDDQGNLRAALGQLDDGSPALDLYDRRGTRRAGLSATDDGPALRLSDPDGTLRAGLGAYDDGPALDLFDAAGRNRGGLFAYDHGMGLSLHDPDGTLRAGLYTGVRNGPLLRLFDERGNVQWEAP